MKVHVFGVSMALTEYIFTLISNRVDCFTYSSPFSVSGSEPEESQLPWPPVLFVFTNCFYYFLFPFSSQLPGCLPTDGGDMDATPDVT